MTYPSYRPALAALVLLSACGAPLQKEGHYAFTYEPGTVVDPCRLLTTPESLWDGNLVVAGETVRLDYELFGTAMVGGFLEVSERFYLDGTATDVALSLPDGTCHYRRVQIHMDGEAQGRTALAGALSIVFETTTDRCGCDLTLGFSAERTAPLP